MFGQNAVRYAVLNVFYEKYMVLYCPLVWKSVALMKERVSSVPALPL